MAIGKNAGMNHTHNNDNIYIGNNVYGIADEESIRRSSCWIKS